MNIMKVRRRRRRSRIDIASIGIDEPDNLLNEWLNYENAAIEPSNPISPIITKSGQIILHGEFGSYPNHAPDY